MTSHLDNKRTGAEDTNINANGLSSFNVNMSQPNKQKTLSQYALQKMNQLELMSYLFDTYGPVIAKKDLETWLAMLTCLKDIDPSNLQFDNYEDIMERCGNIPGDVARQLRTFYNKYTNNGIKQYKLNGKIYYEWDITEQSKNKEPEVPRNIFKNTADREKFLKEKNNKCEICDSNNRLAVDHWRAHSIYNIDNKDIAVLLCERCNNIHKNKDPSVLISKNKNNIDLLKRWINIECRIRQSGFLPNNEDVIKQKNTIKEINDYFINEYNWSIPEAFWKGLDK